ncbi:hypothetical protein PMIN06_004595 [Paraphaeosphaeria minitans]|uniref:Uncharacterized protein n=1 Tax=Paraphaeosphaeria minitans TaxID=565426 RepID=A0A9P6GB31_9PLEO|nr:hypothetical protein PMIN01_10912 [Paraphaeosphaeria minitans]
MPTHEEREGRIVETQPSDAILATTLTPRRTMPVHTAEPPCGVTTTYSVFHFPSKRYLSRANDPWGGVPSDLDEEEIALVKAMVLGRPMEDWAVRAIRKEAEKAEFTARQTEENRNAALLTALRNGVQRDTHNLARLESRLETLRLIVSGLKKEVMHVGDEKAVDALVGWEVPRNLLGSIVDGDRKPMAAGGEEMVKSDSGLGALVEEEEDDVDEDAGCG